MKHLHTQELYDYWTRLRGGEPAPLRVAIEPADISGLLGDTFILENAGPANYPFRLAGTRLCYQFGVELKGRNFLDSWNPSDIGAIASLLSAITLDAAAAVLGIESLNDQGQTTESEMLLLPLSLGGRNYDRILGLKTPMAKPYWLGMHPVIRQTVTSLRLIWPDEPAPRARAMAAGENQPHSPAFDEGRRRPKLVVFQGGKS
jgi:hypothetical protein